MVSGSKQTPLTSQNLFEHFIYNLSTWSKHTYAEQSRGRVGYNIKSSLSTVYTITISLYESTSSMGPRAFLYHESLA